MHLLPPLSKPFGVFAEKSEVALAPWEVDLLIALELERQIQATALWERLFSDAFDRIKKNHLYVSPYPLTYIRLTMETKDEQPGR